MLLTPIVMKLLDDCLVAGVREADFWEMTIGAAVRVTEAYVKQKRDRAYFEFTNAMTTAAFISTMIKGTPPTIHDIYPELYEKDEEAEEQARAEASAANFLKFANAFNQRANNGSGRETESQSGGGRLPGEK